VAAKKGSTKGRGSSTKKSSPAKARPPSGGKRSKPASRKGRSGRKTRRKIPRLSPQTIQILLGLSLGLVLSAIIIWLVWLAAPDEPGVKSSAKQGSAPREDGGEAKGRPGIVVVEPQGASVQSSKPPAYEEKGLAFHRHLALTDAAIVGALGRMGLPDEALKFNRIKNVVEDGLFYERVEIGLDLESVPLSQVEEKLLEALAGLDFGVSLTSTEASEERTVLLVWLGGHLTHTLRLSHRPPDRAAPPPESKRPLAALIIDDLGYHPHLDALLMEIDLPLTVAVLPFSPAGEKAVGEASSRGREVLVHAPMEPHDYPQVNPGPGALLTTMNRSELVSTLTRILASVPPARGVNNHMGSKLTEDEGALKVIMAELKKKGLFFIDSRTSPFSKGLKTAQEAGVKTAERSVFLDNVTDPDAIRAQLRRLTARARKEGRAIAIGHPHPQTAQVLAAMAQELKQELDLVPAGRLVR